MGSRLVTPSRLRSTLAILSTTTSRAFTSESDIKHNKFFKGYLNYIESKKITSKPFFSDPECAEGKLNHAVLLVGYNKTAPEVFLTLLTGWINASFIIFGNGVLTVTAAIMYFVPKTWLDLTWI